MSEREMPKQMDLDSFDQCLEFDKKSGNKRVNIIGGEPFLIPNIGEYIDRIVRMDCFEEVLFFSNGTYDREVNDLIQNYSKRIRINILINLNSESDIGTDRYSNLLVNLQDLYDKGICFDLGYNIYRRNQDYSSFLALAKKYKKKRIRWALVAPNGKELFRDHYKGLTEPGINFMREAYYASVKPEIDCCSIPICLLNDEMIRSIALYAPETFANKICRPSIDVLPDLSVVRCFAMSTSKQKKLCEFKNEREAYIYFIKEIDLKQGCERESECDDCAIFNRYQRCCGCLKLRH